MEKENLTGQVLKNPSEVCRFIAEKKGDQKAVVGFEYDYAIIHIMVDTNAMIPRGFILN